jgi:hypothetical protein
MRKQLNQITDKRSLHNTVNLKIHTSRTPDMKLANPRLPFDLHDGFAVDPATGEDR